jgi:hypothetical protein
MNVRKILTGAMMSVTLGTVAPLVVAQVGPGGEAGGRGHHVNGPQWQACKKQANDKQLPRGPERKAFMQNCLKSSQSYGGQKPPG